MIKKHKKIIIILSSILIISIISITLYLCFFKEEKLSNTDKNEKIDATENNEVIDYDKEEKNKLVLKKLEIKKDEDYDINKFVKTCIINNSKNCSFEYENDEMANYKEPGIYNIVIIASNDNEQIKEKTKLIITDINNVEETKDDKENKNTDIKTSNEPINNNEQVFDNQNTTTTNKRNETIVEQQKYVVDTKTETSEEVSYKYGVTIKRIIYYVYDIYNDGSKVLIDSYDNYSYDYSTFSATTNDMRSEASSIASANSGSINEVLNYTNSYRADVGVGNLVLDWSLTEAATVRALEMGWADYFEHARPNGDSCFTIFDDYGINYWTVGENIAYGYWDAYSVSEGWKNSPGHYASMINENFGRLGVGYAEVNGNRYWVQLFAN